MNGDTGELDLSSLSDADLLSTLASEIHLAGGPEQPPSSLTLDSYWQGVYHALRRAGKLDVYLQNLDNLDSSGGALALPRQRALAAIRAFRS